MAKLNKPEFEKLQAEWDKKLKDSGFEDAEQRDGNLKLWSTMLFRVHHNDTLYRAKEEYYRLAGHFLHDHKFTSTTEHAVWELHAKGMSMRDIVATLKPLGYKVYKWKVQQIIRRLSEEMGRACRS